jgi:SAM-dependent methyltransferase
MKFPLSAEQINTPSHHNATVPNFNHLARPYRWLEYLTFGPFLWRCRTHYLRDLSNCRHALILGDGDGRFTARLLRANPSIRITAVDGSPRMIESVRRAARPCHDRLTTEIADLRTWKPLNPEPFDLVVAHFFLDCLTTREVAQMAARVTPGTTAGALWLVSEFAIPGTLFGRMLAAPVVKGLYFAFRCLTGLNLRSLPDYPQALGSTGWQPQKEHRHLSGLLVSQLWCRRKNPSR